MTDEGISNDTPGGDSTDKLASIPYEVIHDKQLATQDHLYKLIIIGDTGKLVELMLISNR